MYNKEIPRNDFRPPATAQEVAQRIGYPLTVLLRVVAEIHDHYDKRSKVKRDKKTNKPITHKGKIRYRIHHAPSKELKRILRAVNKKILAKIPLPDCVFGVKGASAIDNAKIHQGKKYHFVTDLVNFYPSITAPKVYKTFRQLGFGSEASRLLRDLVTLHGLVPQGAPTSSQVANLVFLPTDYALIEFCKNHDLIYSRYVDDLTFSSAQNFEHLNSPLLSIIKGSGFKVSYKKTGFKAGPAGITGPIVKQNGISASEAVVKNLNDPKNSAKRNKGIRDYIQLVESASRRSGSKKRQAKADK